MNHPLLDSFWSSQYAPHGYCLLWRPDLIGLHLVSDILIALAYFSIPIALIRFVRRRDDLQFGAIFWLFAVFILACGMTHVMGAWNLWHGNYGLEGVIKAITAAASVPTAILLWRIMPQALAIPSQQQLRQSNEHLTALIMERDLAVSRLEEQMRQRERTEAALVQSQKVDAIGQLTAGIAHDFNNLLQAISGNLELIRTKAEPESPTARWVGNAIKAVGRGTKLSKQLLVFSRVQRLELRQVDVDHVVNDMRELLDKSIDPTIEIDLDLAAAPCSVMTDANQLEMSLLNLAINARDAMPEGGRLTIATRCTHGSAPSPDLDSGGYVEIRVTDTGTGMDADVLARALDPFFTTKEVGKGTGLGLSMAFGFARQSGGTLQVDSVEGQGTTIAIYLPTSDGAASEDENDQPSPKGRLLGRRARRGTAILVDDDDDVRPVVEEMLGDLGFSLRSYAHPDAFLEAFDGTKSDLLVLDFMMPGINGAKVAQRVRSQVPDQRIILISGFSESASIDAVEGPGTRLLRKPFGMDDLDRLIAELDAEQGPADEPS